MSALEAAILAALEDPNWQVRREAVKDAAKTADPEELVRAVGDQANAIRRNAALEALMRGGARSVGALIKALSDPDPEVIMFAAGALGTTREPSAAPRLITLLEHPDVNIVQAAIQSLGQLRATSAVEPLFQLLGRDVWIRFAAVHSLGEIGDPRAVAALVPLLEDEEIGDEVVAVLGRIASVDALAALSTFLQRHVDSPRFAGCLRAIGTALDQHHDERRLGHVSEFTALGADPGASIRARLVRVLKERGSDPSPETRELHAAAVAMVRALRLSDLYSIILVSAEDPSLHDLLQYCVVAIGPDISPSLTVGLAWPNAEVRRFTCRCVAALGVRETAGALERLLRDEDAVTRVAAVEALTTLEHQPVLPSLARLAREDAAPEVRRAALAGLARLDPSAFADLLGDPAAHTRDDLLAILDVLHARIDAGHRAFVEACLRHADADVRSRAVATLAAFPAAAVEDALSALLDDPAMGPRLDVIAALGTLRTPRARALLLARLSRDMQPMTRLHVVRALGQAGDEAVARRLLDLYEAEAPPVRLGVIEALGELKSVAAKPLLVRLLDDQDAEVRRTAVRALSRFATEDVMRHVHAAGRDRDWRVRAAVVETLASQNDASALPHLERLALDGNEAVAAVARRRLEDLGVA